MLVSVLFVRIIYMGRSGGRGRYITSIQPTSNRSFLYAARRSLQPVFFVYFVFVGFTRHDAGRIALPVDRAHRAPTVVHRINNHHEHGITVSWLHQRQHQRSHQGMDHEQRSHRGSRGISYNYTVERKPEELSHGQRRRIDEGVEVV